MRRTGLGRHGRIEDQAGDPLDGLVNLFDIGVVLAVAFLLAGLTLAVEGKDGAIVPPSPDPAAERVRVVREPPSPRRARGRGAPFGTAYRLADGRLVIVSPLARRRIDSPP